MDREEYMLKTIKELAEIMTKLVEKYATLEKQIQTIKKKQKKPSYQEGFFYLNLYNKYPAIVVTVNPTIVQVFTSSQNLVSFKELFKLSIVI